MTKYRVIVETIVYVEADNEEDAVAIFYDNVYEVDRHGQYRVELVES